jgi:hypothetical protein
MPTARLWWCVTKRTPPRSYAPKYVVGAFCELRLERLSGKCSADAVVAYALRYGEHEIPH